MADFVASVGEGRFRGHQTDGALEGRVQTSALDGGWNGLAHGVRKDLRDQLRPTLLH